MRIREAVKNAFKSKMYLVWMIGLSAICGGYVLSGMVSFFGLFSNAFYLVAPLITMIFGWQLFAGNVTLDNVKKLKVYSVFMQVVSIVLASVMGLLIVALLMLIIGLRTLVQRGFNLNDIWNELYGSVYNELGPMYGTFIEQYKEFLELGLVFLVVALTIAMFILVAFLIWFATTCSAIKKYLKEIESAYEMGVYNVNAKIPTARLWTFGVLFGLSGLSAMSFGLVAALPALGMATYYIFCVYWFKETHAALAEAQNEQDFETFEDKGEASDNCSDDGNANMLCPSKDARESEEFATEEAVSEAITEERAQEEKKEDDADKA